MAEMTDMIGFRSGKLEVIAKAEGNQHGKALWLCRCDCGNEIVVCGADLRNQHTKSCGCLKRAKDMTGEIFGYLTVLKRSDKTDSSRRVYWDCLCKCGAITTVAGAHLRSGNTKSCGCLISKGNLRIGEILRDANIDYIPEKSFSDLLSNSGRVLRFDFYLPTFNTVIEYQGEQHYSAVMHFGGDERFQLQQSYDKKKRDYCANNNIRYIEIPYQDYSMLSQDYVLNLLRA